MVFAFVPSGITSGSFKTSRSYSSFYYSASSASFSSFSSSSFTSASFSSSKSILAFPPSTPPPSIISLQSSLALTSTLPLVQIPRPYKAVIDSLPTDAQPLFPIGSRHTKIIATIGPQTSSREALLQLAAGGVNVIRLNMSHGDYEFHAQVIRRCREIAETTPYNMAVVVDIGSLDMLRIGNVDGEVVLKQDQQFTLTSRHLPNYEKGTVEVSYDGFFNIVEVGDLVQLQSNDADPVEMVVTDIQNESDAICKVISKSGTILSRASLFVRGKSYSLNVKSLESDLEECQVLKTTNGSRIPDSSPGCHPLDEIEFAIENKVDYIALSFTESPDTVRAVRAFLNDKGVPQRDIGVLAKIESEKALQNISQIIEVADGVVVARGDLGTAIPYDKVPLWQVKIADQCRDASKFCIVSTHFLESMVMYPTPTRAEVSDIFEAVQQRVDGLQLTSETASGKFPFKALDVMNKVALRAEAKIHQKIDYPMPELMSEDKNLDKANWSYDIGHVAENIAQTATILSNQRQAGAILVFTQRGLMASLVSRCRPNAPIFAFTPSENTRNKLNLYYGVCPFLIDFDEDPEVTIQAAIADLKFRNAIRVNDTIIVVADVLGGAKGASEEEIKSVFTEFAKDSGVLSAKRLRGCLRKLGLKLSDAEEFAFGLDQREMVGSLSKAIIDFERFRSIVHEAKEIVHTVQMRIVL